MRMKPNLGNYYRMRKENSKNTQMLEETNPITQKKCGEEKRRWNRSCQTDFGE